MAERIWQYENHGIIFALFDGYKIQLETRKRGKYKGLNIVPGGGVDQGETTDQTVIRETREEYGVIPTQFKKLGVLLSSEGVGTINYRHVYLITEWEGDLFNPKEKSAHIESTLNDAYMLCDHPLSRKVLDMVSAEVLKVDL